MSSLRTLLLISNQKSSFLTKTLESYLQEEDFVVITSGFDMDEFSKITTIPKLILLSFDGIEDKDKQFLNHIRDLCLAKEKWVYLCGQENEAKCVASILPAAAILGTCTRPFDIPDLIKSMNHLIQDEERLAVSSSENFELSENFDVPKRVMFLSNKQASFLASAIKSRLQNEGFDIISESFDIDLVSKINEKPNLVLLYIEGIEKNDSQFLFYLRDLCIEEEKRVLLCGHEYELKEVIAILQNNSVIAMFNRPFNISDVINRMNKEIDRYKRDQGKKHILVVDDSGEMLLSIRRWLSDTYRISIVNSGANAILFLANHKPDLILLDYEMPFCSGPQMMEMLRAEATTSSIPIMFLTGKSDKESLMKVLSLKPQGYMLKSMPPEKIKENITEFFIAQKAEEYNKGKQL